MTASPRKRRELLQSSEPAIAADSVLGELTHEPYRFDFFQAVRLLSLARPMARPIGHDASPDQEVVRLRSLVSTSFPPSDLNDFQPADPRSPPALQVRFMALAGVAGPLPDHYTQIYLERLRAEKAKCATRDFFDLFHHRVLSLFYRAWKKYRLWVDAEVGMRKLARTDAADRAALRHFHFHDRPKVDPCSRIILSLVGMAIPELRYQATNAQEAAARLAVADETLIYFSGLLSRRHRSAVGLQGMLAEQFRVPTAVEQFRARWTYLSDRERTQITPRSSTALLGRTTIVGRRIWEAQSRFRVRLGPLNFEQFQSFLPRGANYRSLKGLIRIYAGPEFEFEIQLILGRACVPRTRLGCRGGQAFTRLGYESWVLAGSSPTDRDDPVFRPKDRA